MKHINSIKKSIRLALFGILIFTSTVTFSQSSPYPATDDEFVGPFPSWLNVKTAFGAVGDGVADETAALQAAFDAIGQSTSTASVVYLPAGTYRITGPLTLNSKINVSVIGSDPATTKIIWGGASGGTMMHIDGTAYSRFNRITWDGNNIADTAIDQSWNGSAGYFDTGNEYADDLFKNVAVGIRGGQKGFGFAETAIMRCQFIHNSFAGVSLGNFNALDIWVWNSVFENCGIGVTNILGAGNFKIYNSIFRNSVNADIVIGNTGEFSFRDNTSTNSNAFLVTIFKRYPALITLQSNTIIDPVTSTAINVGNHGPLTMMDNIIRSRSGATSPVVSHICDPTSDFISIGNKYTVENPIQTTARLIKYDPPVVDRSSLMTLAEQSLPETQPNYNRQVFEVPLGSDAAAIQTIVNQAVASSNTRPVVHFPHGNYFISSTITIPANSDVQLVGDGDGYDKPTWLRWNGSGTAPVIKINGPGKATLRDFSINGNSTSKLLQILNADQPSSRVFMHQVENANNSNNLLVNGLDYTNVLIYNSDFSGSSSKAVQVIGGPQTAAGSTLGGKTILYAASGSGNYLTHEVTNGGSLLVRDMWYESSLGATNINLVGKGNFTAEGSHISSPRNAPVPQIAINNFIGKATFINTDIQDRVAINGDGSRTNFLGLGVLTGESSMPAFSITSYIQNNASPAGDVRSFNSRASNDPNIVTPRYGSYALPDAGLPDSVFITSLLQQARNEHAQVLTALPPGITDVRLYRLSVSNGITGIEIAGSGNAILPVQFVSTSASCNNGSVLLTWRTSVSTNKFFKIERSEGGLAWKEIGTVTGNPNNQVFSFTDVAQGKFLYRIIAVDFQNKSTRSNILFSPCRDQQAGISLFPNPVDQRLLVQIISKNAAVNNWIMYDAKGSKVKSGQVFLTNGVNQFSIDIDALPRGMYTIQTNGDGQHQSQKFIRK